MSIEMDSREAAILIMMPMKPELSTEVVKVRKSTKARLDRLKIIPEETYDSVINRGLDKLEAKA